MIATCLSSEDSEKTENSGLPRRIPKARQYDGGILQHRAVLVTKLLFNQVKGKM
tara:strand:- start:109 stop:270 length:162 start_codon:yes stop_codon:yes gene_type:complete